MPDQECKALAFFSSHESAICAKLKKTNKTLEREAYDRVMSLFKVLHKKLLSSINLIFSHFCPFYCFFIKHQKETFM